MSQTKWIPEAPSHSGLYANESGTDMDRGKIKGMYGLQPSTMMIDCAKQFDSKEECQTWCADNPKPVFAPAEHQFM